MTLNVSTSSLRVTQISLESIKSRVDLDNLQNSEQKNFMIMFTSINQVLASGNANIAESVMDILKIRTQTSGSENLPWWYQVLVEEFSQAIISLKAQQCITHDRQSIPHLQQEVLERLPL